MSHDSVIRILDPGTANRIAAGEVVEGPAAVVKELVENSLDAGATQIRIRIAGGGEDFIEVQDDGRGMSAADARLAVEPHATSKIRHAGDLETIATLGFRGEALPSIASVAHLELVTRPPDSVAGFRLVLAGGQPAAAGPTGCPVGTRVVVRDLFFNTPARRKHLKAPGTEFARVAEATTALALARPEVRFQLERDGRAVLSTPGRGELLATVVALFGTGLGRELLPVDATAGGVSITGLAGRPLLTRSTRSHQYFSLNGRPVANGELARALDEAYATLLTVGRHAVAFMRIAVPPGDADVNIHPAKRVVRFAHTDLVLGALTRGVRHALAVGGLIPALRLPAQPSAQLPDRSADGSSDRHVPAAVPAGYPPAAGLDRADTLVTGEEQLRWWAAAAAPLEEAAVTGPGIADLEVLGQVAATYIVARDATALYLIDQHAAHERVYYERYLEEVGRGTVASQLLTHPMPCQLSPAEAALWAEHGATLAWLGFQTEPFGDDTVLLRSVPYLLAGTAGLGLLQDLLAAAGGSGGPAFPGAGDLLSDDVERLIRFACKAAVKAHDPLDRAEMEALLAQLAAAANPYTCPHGRPTLIRLTVSDLEKQFRRT